MTTAPIIQFTKRDWLARANDVNLKEKREANTELEYFDIIVAKAQACQTIDWQQAVSLLHMVYGWMPTMLTIGEQNADQRNTVPRLLTKARSGKILDDEELKKLMKFTNRSMVGASKLLHVLRPKTYPIWDSRVARVFLWAQVPIIEFKNNTYYSQYNKANRYLDYRLKLLEWVLCPSVQKKCKTLRNASPYLQNACDLRMVELVLFHETEQEEADRKKRKADEAAARKKR